MKALDGMKFLEISLKSFNFKPAAFKAKRYLRLHSCRYCLNAFFSFNFQLQEGMCGTKLTKLMAWNEDMGPIYS